MWIMWLRNPKKWNEKLFETIREFSQDTKKNVYKLFAFIGQQLPIWKI